MPFRVVILFTFILLPAVSFSQKSEIDSLESLVRSVPSDTTKVWLLNKLVNALREKDNNKALVFAQQSKDLAELLGYKNGLSHALENLGWIYYRKGDFSKSLYISSQALKLSEELNDQYRIARCLINVAAIHYEQKQYRQAIDHFKKAYRVSEKNGDKQTMARSMNNTAYAFVRLEELDSAFVECQKALTLSIAAEDPYMIAFAHRTLGDIFVARKNMKQALQHLNACYALALKHNNMFIHTSVLHRIANVYFISGKYDLAIEQLTLNIKTAEELGFKDELERAYKLISEVYYKKKDLAQAYHFQSLYVGIHDSLYDQRNSEQIALMQIRFDTELKQAQIELLTKDAALKAEDIKRKQVWIYFYVGCLSLLIILAFVLFYNNRHNNLAKLALEEKNNEIQEHTHQLRNLNSTKDKMFSIISHDLRSPVASLKALMEIVSTTGLSQQEFVDISKVLKRNLDSVYDDLDNLLVWAQTQLKGISAHPEEIDLRKLAEEKTNLFEEAAASKKIVMVNDIPPGTIVLADRNHLNLVIRNLIANAIKFNRSNGTITLSAKEYENKCQVSVADSGIGISHQDIARLFNSETHFSTPGTHKEKGVGIGLLLTKEFIEKNHGSIWVDSEVGKGATFTFTLKLRRYPALA
jgi:two-component system, sensor histidine kinase and response regulator